MALLAMALHYTQLGGSTPYPNPNPNHGQVGGSTPLDAASVNACMRRNEGVGCDLLTYRDARGMEHAADSEEVSQ